MSTSYISMKLEELRRVLDEYWDGAVFIRWCVVIEDERD